MAKALLYIKPTCPYCIRAINTMEKLGMEYTTLDVSKDPALLKEMYGRTGGKTVPQIYLYIGGSDDFHQLVASGALKGVLGTTKGMEKSSEGGACSVSL